MKNVIFLVLLSLPLVLFGQRIDNTLSYRDIGTDRYFRFNYDNDFFSASDLYYTQGYSLELATPWLRKNPLNTLFIKPDGSTIINGIALEKSGFIPTDITADEILYGDRPYAATITLKSFLVATDTVAKQRLASSLTIGMIGPAAFGDEMQTAIHEWIDDDIPMGWQYQIKNDLIINYELSFEKQLVRLTDFAAVTSHTKARLGTLNTSLATGFTIALGLLNSSYSDKGNNKKFQIYIYSHPMGALVGYDATMQGGVFNSKNPYTIPSSGIERFTLQNDYGLVMRYNSFYFEYSQAVLTREFKTGNSHRWGGFKIGFRI